MIERLDHINIRTAQLDRMIAWYSEVLDLTPGRRPDFGFPGAWLYAGDHALVHLVGVDSPPTDPGTDLKLEHGAFSATGFAGFKARLEARGERMRVAKLPGFPVVQVNVWDPDGNHLHVDFDAAEVDPSDYA
ncbi:VOC family protein [Thalassococcus sp. BH17M4-6]|uniref:VOC family protein n=1 Tax=Thalassococcus sp. BH17M4-6 TaxID=3413148 RepID=UPI003BDE9B29